MTKKVKKQPIEYIYGINSITECLKAKQRKIIALYTTRPEPKAFLNLQKLLPKYPVQIQYVLRDKLQQLAHSDDHQGVVAMVQKFPYRTSIFNPKKAPFILLLDGIQDVRNLGGILRTAYCTGVQGVILCRKGGTAITSAAHKASAGFAEYLPIYQAASAQEAAQQVQNAGYQLYTTTFNGENAAEVVYKKPLCVVIGSERKGVTPSIIKNSIQVSVPQKEQTISYNASVATGITLFLVAHKIGAI